MKVTQLAVLLLACRSPADAFRSRSLLRTVPKSIATSSPASNASAKQALLLRNVGIKAVDGGKLGKATLETKMGSLINDMLNGQGGVDQSLESSLGSSILKVLEGRGTNLRHIVEVAHQKMDIEDAVRRLEGKLPTDIESLVHLTGGKAVAQRRAEFSEDSLQKARRILNSMMEGAWEDLDRVMIACKEFEEKNRETFSQVISDIARLGSQVANLERKKVGTNQGISDKDRTRQSVEEELSQKTQAYNAERAANAAQMTIRKNDLAVFSFILNMTRCPDQGGFVQLSSVAAESPLMVCSTDSGLEIQFNNPQTQARFEQLMTPSARLALREALGQAQAQARGGGGELNLLEMGNITTALPSPPTGVEPAPVKEEPSAGQWKKCTDGKPNCGLLHDTVSLQWGKFKDLVDELQASMDKNFDQFQQLKGNLNGQLTVLGDGKRQDMEVLAETISTMNLDNQERMEKDEQHRELEKEYKKKMAQCRAQIEEILFTNICAVRKVRNEVMKSSSISPPSNITDCDVKDWVASECSVDCDDKCPLADPYACGGTQKLTREVIVISNEHGVKCPVLETTKKCNQFKCPVNCVMSMWSGWSKCSKECEGGVQGKTRSIVTKPKNGGSECDSVQEVRACNTGSCDRDCALASWSAWSPCSMACGGGFTDRGRKVTVPIRGQGKCPATRNAVRLEEKECNVQPCVGDEICIAKQDLLILLDASGSLKESGFEILKHFAANLTKKYESEYFGAPAMQVGAVLFGNGFLRPDGSIMPAIQVVGLTSDMTTLRQAILATTWQRGFTNMAQAMVLADTMLQQGGRGEAQSALLVLSDGKYSFEFETAEKVRELKDKNVQILMAPVSDFDGTKELKKFKEWASQPWETNYERIPGLTALKFNQETFASKLIAKFCSDSVSPSQQKGRDQSAQYMLVREGGVPSESCANKTKVGVLQSVAECASVAREQGKTAFSFGSKLSKGECWVEAMNVTHAWFMKYLIEREKPPCIGGNWTPNPYFDTYALEPPMGA